MLVRRPNAAAATAATMSVVKLLAATCANSGASSTPARPANRLDSIHENVLTRSALIPASSVMRGLSTTARICRPIADHRNSATNPTADQATTFPLSVCCYYQTVFDYPGVTAGTSWDWETANTGTPDDLDAWVEALLATLSEQESE